VFAFENHQQEWDKEEFMLRIVACFVTMLFAMTAVQPASAQTTASPTAAAKPSKMKLTAERLRQMRAQWNSNRGKLKMCRKEVRVKGLAGDDRWFYIEDCMNKS
jgi:hypothetical protein